jgi:glutamine synthetase
VGIRVPRSSPEARRVENRVIGADANPYVATAVTLACGYLGMKDRLEPTAESSGSAYDVAYELPRTMSEALNLLAGTPALANVLGERFATIYRLVKELEYDEFMQVISSWEREHLLLHV